MMNNKHIVIVDSGVGNIWSVLKAVRQFAPDAVVTEEREKAEAADALILPGVGTFKAGMDGLLVRGLIDPIQDAAKRGVPILGICLGAQLLLERGYEFGEHKGLGLIQGEVRHFPPLREGVKVPAIGWQKVTPQGTQTLLADLSDPYFYFVHSYVLQPSTPAAVLATTTYGDYAYPAVIGEGSVQGTQFHPEKSGEAGLTLLRNFISSI